MSYRKHIVYLAIACAAISCLLALTASPAAASTWTPVFADNVHNGTMKTFNNCFIQFNLVEGSNSAHIEVSAVGHTSKPIELQEHATGDYDNLVRIYVAKINKTTDDMWVEIAVPSDSGGVTPTPAPGGTKLTCDTPGLQALAGDTVTFPITIQNNNNEDMTYTLSASSGTGWALRFVSGDKGLYKLYVPRTSSKTVTLEVRTSGATGVGEKKVTASVDGQSIDVFVLITSVNQSADVTATVSSKIASIGDKITYDIKIRNLQTQENIYRLSASGLPENWYYRYKESASGTEELAETVVPAGGEKNLVLEIVPPYSVAAGDYNITATVTEPGGNVINKDFMLRLKSGVGMTMQSSKLALRREAGTDLQHRRVRDQQRERHGADQRLPRD